MGLICEDMMTHTANTFEGRADKMIWVLFCLEMGSRLRFVQQESGNSCVNWY